MDVDASPLQVHINTNDNDTSSPFYCPITHEVQKGSTLSIDREPHIYNPQSLVSYLTTFKSLSPISRRSVVFADLLLHQPGSLIGVQLETLLTEYLQREDVYGAASTLVNLGFSVNIPFRVPLSIVARPDASLSQLRIMGSFRVNLLTWCLLTHASKECASSLIHSYNANINLSWSRMGTRDDNSADPWCSDELVWTDTTEDQANSTVDIYTRLSCLSLLLDETICIVDKETIRWAMENGAHVNSAHMQQAISLCSVELAFQVQDLLLSFPSVKVNYVGANSVETTFDHIMYRAMDSTLDNDGEQDEHKTIVAMLLRILDDEVVRRQTLSALTVCGAHILRQYHFLRNNPFRSERWVKIMERLMDMGAVVDSEMMEYALGSLPGDKGFPRQYRPLDYNKWIGSRHRWPDDVVLSLCHSVPPHVITIARNLLTRAVLYSRSPSVIVALVLQGSSRHDMFDGQTALQWAEQLEKRDLIAKLNELKHFTRQRIDDPIRTMYPYSNNNYNAYPHIWRTLSRSHAPIA